MIEQRRYHILIEQKVDVFIDICKKAIQAKNLENKIWVEKNEISSMVGIGDPDKLMHNKDFGFSFSYEAIIERFEDTIYEFEFKLDHYIKTANSTNKFKNFRK